PPPLLLPLLHPFARLSPLPTGLSPPLSSLLTPTRLTMTSPSRIPRSASASASSTSLLTSPRRKATITTSPFFTPNRFASLEVERCPRSVLVRRSRTKTAPERRAAKRAALRETRRRVLEEMRLEEEAEAAYVAAARPSSPPEQATTTYRRYFYGRPPQETFSLDEMRVADGIVDCFGDRTTRVTEGRRVEVPLRELVLRRNLLRSLTVLEFKTTLREEDDDWMYSSF
ncbi:hypothetical protein PMAYCL1PPCAC_22843, partial [Pristionchus mayeri]